MTDRFRILVALVSVCLVVACTRVDHSEELLRDDEVGQGAATRASFEKLVEAYRTEYVARGAHAKAHACVRAYFDVLPDLRAEFRHGVFAEPGRRYRTWVRFSNGHYDLRASPDHKNDARGMALKLLEIDGEPLEQDGVNGPTQDFLMANTPVFFVRNMPDYNSFIANPEDLKSFFFPGWNPFKWRIREVFAGKQVLSPAPASVLDPMYFSITPYKLGPRNIKFAARPCHARPVQESAIAETGDHSSGADSSGADFLGEQLRAELAHTGACFIFQVQVQDPDAQAMSLDDATRAWPEQEAPFVPLATLSIPRQDFSGEEQAQFCENLAFAPWHALPAHRPLGQLNRLRRHAYPASSDYRHAQNEAQIPDAVAYWEAGGGARGNL
ncbi:MAG: catalase [Gammaproteobacteria bacterium]|nr:catalase [Gammaproteobacteria bacterium]MCY4210619.1 catalase [Gammaproteobacteria bacterium]MCY4282002.1 catalase [Gammaproteobacteria bacterium]MCY4337211.1 catalase [Gammaproteobacteria bacterium]